MEREGLAIAYSKLRCSSLHALAMALSIGNLKDVLKATYDARHKWDFILLMLGVSHSTIQSLRRKYNNDPDQCFLEGLSDWLRGGPRQWSDIVKALRDKTVCCEDVASEIEKSFGNVPGLYILN